MARPEERRERGRHADERTEAVDRHPGERPRVSDSSSRRGICQHHLAMMPPEIDSHHYHPFSTTTLALATPTAQTLHIERTPPRGTSPCCPVLPPILLSSSPCYSAATHTSAL